MSAEAGTWLTYSEAARATGELPDKLRGMVRRGRLQAKPPEAFNDRKARVLIPPGMIRGQGDSVAVGQGAGMAADQGDSQGEGAIAAMLRGELAVVREEAAEARVDAALARGELAAKDALVAELRAALEHERTERAELVTAERARADRLEAALAEARRPWLARVLEGLRRR